MSLAIGDAVPDFEATTDKGDKLRLSDYRDKKNVVLFFYPKDFTPTCTAEACGFRDMYSELVGKDTEVIGISADSEASHGKFRERYGLPFPLVADKDKRLARLFGARNLFVDLLGMTTRLTYVIDKSQKVRAVIKAQLSANAHLDEVRATLEAIQKATAP